MSPHIKQKLSYFATNIWKIKVERKGKNYKRRVMRKYIKTQY